MGLGTSTHRGPMTTTTLVGMYDSQPVSIAKSSENRNLDDGRAKPMQSFRSDCHRYEFTLYTVTSFYLLGQGYVNIIVREWIHHVQIQFICKFVK